MVTQDNKKYMEIEQPEKYEPLFTDKYFWDEFLGFNEWIKNNYKKYHENKNA